MFSFRKSVFCVGVLFFSCQTTKGSVVAPTVVSQDLETQDQTMTTCQLVFDASLNAPYAYQIESAKVESVIEGAVVRTNVENVQKACEAAKPCAVSFSAPINYAKDSATLKNFDTKGGSILTSLRGVFVVKAGESRYEVPFAKAKEVRVPRLVRVVMRENEGARYNDTEAKMLVRLGVKNPNQFYVNLSGLSWKMAMNDKIMGEGVVGAGEKVAPSSTGVFEVEVLLNESTYGKDVKKLIAQRDLRFKVSGELTGDLMKEPYDYEGKIVLPAK